jgi:hypothetical protein
MNDKNADGLVLISNEIFDYVEPENNRNPIKELQMYACSVRLQKLARSTYIQSCQGLAEFLKLPIGRAGEVAGPEGQAIGRIEHFAPAVWMCSIGKLKPEYGYTPEEAAINAMKITPPN